MAAAIMIAVLALLAARLWYLQLVQGESYAAMSLTNRVQTLRHPPSRGRILDRNGRVLADNSPSFTLSIIRGELENPRELVEACSATLGMPPERLRHAIERSASIPRYLMYPLKRNLSLEQISLIRTRMADLRGVVLETKPRRLYPYGSTLCHVIGTIGQISRPELVKGAETGYRSGDLVGKTGIEKEYEPYLKGVEGWERIEIDAKGRQLGTLAVKMPEQGADIVLTADAELQRFVEEIFVHRAGSVVALDCDTGEILAMVSTPGFDPNLFSPSVSECEWKELSTDPLHPLENRAVRGLYSPASTFKIVTAAAALAEGVIKPDHTFTCKGELELRGQRFRCWNHYGHGRVALHRAIVESCDVYFYELGLKLGPDRIAKYASLFGMGKPTGLGLPQELPGLIPTSPWKLRTYGEPWKDGETINMAIGQGYLVCTPVQLAVMTAAVANGGRVLKPTIVKQIRGHDGKIIFEHATVERWTLPLDEKSLAFLRAAMSGVVTERMGTGKKCQIPGLKVAGKTGTSQVVRQKQRVVGESQAPYHERTHAIFVAYVDHMPKKIAVAVVVEHGGGGGQVAAPIARKVICKYYGVPDPGDKNKDE
ncbi:MAG: penicillin-binding protein 2 [Desulfomonile sp.]|nr:penicillin-binding protein 2 [Desulfomonile sp.]